MHGLLTLQWTQYSHHPWPTPRHGGHSLLQDPALSRTCPRYTDNLDLMSFGLEWHDIESCSNRAQWSVDLPFHFWAKVTWKRTLCFEHIKFTLPRFDRVGGWWARVRRQRRHWSQNGDSEGRKHNRGDRNTRDELRRGMAIWEYGLRNLSNKQGDVGLRNFQVLKITGSEDHTQVKIPNRCTRLGVSGSRSGIC